MNRRLIVFASAATLILVAVAIVYFTRSAQELPPFLPGRQAGLTRHNTKHGIAILPLAVSAVIFGRMLSGRSGHKSSRP